MAILEIGIGSFIGTIFMSLFSYFMSDLVSEKLGEATLLNMLIENANNSSVNPIVGWIVHWLYVAILPLWVTSVLTGALSGIIGIIGWLIMFYLHPRPPKLNFPLFFKQLFVAHILFALGAFLSFHIF